ncbi:MAG: hypothetical protein JSS55_15245 [Proteobacteria bacterium]|nr:hypothetical protein [Pseudomonadota bacterium]
MNKAIILPLLALAACQAAPETNAAQDAEAANQANAPVKDIETLPPDETVVPPANEAAAPSEPAPKTIPAAFRGRWGMVPNDCDPKRDDAKGLVEIGADSMKFYESRAKLAKVTGAWPEKIEAEFAYSGEGQNWTKKETLALTGSSNTLTRTEPEGAFTYKRCPA